MKKKILITSFDLQIGGVERSLLGLLSALDCTRYDVSLFLYSHQGEFMSQIPEDITLLPQIKAYSMLKMPITHTFREGFPLIGMARLTSKATGWFKRYIFGMGGDMIVQNCRFCLPFFPRIRGSYDLVLSFASPHYCATHRVVASKRIGWIHSDYQQIECGVDRELELPMWQRLDAIAAVSTDVMNSFIKVFPEIRDKVVVIENILSPEFVRQQAKAFDPIAEMPQDSNTISICSVGRFCHQKNFDSIPAVVRLLNDKDRLSIKWYLIGYGGDEELIRAKIAEAGVEGQVVILGKKINPYPYMQACDIYVQPSRHEGKAVTVREAQMLGKPVLITNFPTAKSQLEDNVDGLICSLDDASIAKAILQLINDRELCNRLAQTAFSRDYGNANELDKIYRLMEV